MKVFTLAIFLCLGLISFSQSLDIRDLDENTVVSDTVYVDVNYEDYDIDTDVLVENTSSSTIKVNVTRIEDDVMANTSNYFCWAVCTGVVASGAYPEVTPAGYITMSPGEIGTFTLYYDPNYQVGNSLFKIEFFDTENTADSSVVYISITSYDYASVQENQNIAPIVKENILYTGNSKGEVKIYNLAGQQVLMSNENQIPIDFLNPGVYLVVIENKTYKIFKS